jgi:hypothetical protein
MLSNEARSSAPTDVRCAMRIKSLITPISPKLDNKGRNVQSKMRSLRSRESGTALCFNDGQQKMQTGMHEVLELSEQQLRRRNSAKWAMHGAGVIPASIAEMDFALDAVVTKLQAARDHLGARLHAEMPSARVILPEATYLAWIDFSGLSLSESAFRHFLARGVALSDGETFDSSCASFARLDFATSLPLLDRIIDRMADT